MIKLFSFIIVLEAFFLRYLPHLLLSLCHFFASVANIDLVKLPHFDFIFFIHDSSVNRESRNRKYCLASGRMAPEFVCKHINALGATGAGDLDASQVNVWSLWQSALPLITFQQGYLVCSLLNAKGNLNNCQTWISAELVNRTESQNPRIR